MAIGYKNWGNSTTDKKTVAKPKRKSRLPKGRSTSTYKSKLRKLKSYYKLTFKHSQENKKRNIASDYKIKKLYFFEKFPKLENFLKTTTLKQPNQK